MDCMVYTHININDNDNYSKIAGFGKTFRILIYRLYICVCLMYYVSTIDCFTCNNCYNCLIYNKYLYIYKTNETNKYRRNYKHIRIYLTLKVIILMNCYINSNAQVNSQCIDVYANTSADITQYYISFFTYFSIVIAFTNSFA